MSERIKRLRAVIDAMDEEARRLRAENAALRKTLDALLHCVGEIKRDEGCDTCPMYVADLEDSSSDRWCLLRPVLRELGFEVRQKGINK